MNAKHFSGGLFGIIMGTIVIINSKEPLATYYSLPLIFLGLILFFNSFRKRYAYSNTKSNLENH